MYEFQCENSHKVEAKKSINDDLPMVCPDCRKDMKRVPSTFSFVFKTLGEM